MTRALESNALPRGLYNFASKVVRHSARDRILISASSLAFHWFVAVVPAAIAVVGITKHAGLSPSRLKAFAHDISILLPSSASKVFDQALSSKASGSGSVATVIIATLVALWASLESVATLQVALDMAYETNSDRGFLARRVHGLLLLAVTIAFGGGAFVLLVIGNAVGSLIHPTGNGGWFPAVWTAIRWSVGIACVVALISLYDLLGPTRSEQRWRLLTVGGCVSTVLWLAAACGYSEYLDRFGHSSQAYGSLSGVVALLLWLFLGAAAILIGAEVNRELERAVEPTNRKVSVRRTARRAGAR